MEEKGKIEPGTKLNRQFTIEDFEIVEKLGRGTYGDVFLVKEKRTKFLCVLKSLSKKSIKEKKLE